MYYNITLHYCSEFTLLIIIPSMLERLDPPPLSCANQGASVCYVEISSKLQLSSAAAANF